MKKERVFHKTCEVHGSYEAPGPRSKCPECCAPKDHPTHPPLAKGRSEEGCCPSARVLDALQTMGLVRPETVAYLRGLCGR